MCCNLKMDNPIYLCLITIVLMQFPSSGEAYSAGRKRNGYLDNEVDKLEDEKNDVHETLWKRLIHQARETSQQERKATEAADEEIEELLNSFIAAAAKGLDLNRFYGHLNRQNKRSWWWPGACTRCQTSKLTFNFSADLLNCKCNTDTPMTCKCPDGTFLTENGK